MRVGEILRVLIAVGLLGCGGSRKEPVVAAPAAAPSTATDEPGDEAGGIGACAAHGMMGMYAPAQGTHVEQHAATGAAGDAAERAVEAMAANDYLGAARHYLECAERLREVPDGHDQEQTAIRNGQVCYYNAIHSYASAGRFEAEGRAALTAAADRDPRLAGYIAEQLAEPILDCAAAPPEP